MVRESIQHAVAGDIILQPDSWNDITDVLIWLRSPRFAHCGIYVGDGKMIAADFLQGGVTVQDAGAAGSIAASCDWTKAPDVRTVIKWAELQLGKRYDLIAWARILLCLHSQLPGDRYTCSSLVGAALYFFNGQRCYRETTPDEIARLLGV